MRRRSVSWAACPEEALYDNLATIVNLKGLARGLDDRREIDWNPTFPGCYWVSRRCCACRIVLRPRGRPRAASVLSEEELSVRV
jgi:hypothetical protein